MTYPEIVGYAPEVIWLPRRPVVEAPSLTCHPLPGPFHRHITASQPASCRPKVGVYEGDKGRIPLLIDVSNRRQVPSHTPGVDPRIGGSIGSGPLNCRRSLDQLVPQLITYRAHPAPSAPSSHFPSPSEPFDGTSHSYLVVVLHYVAGYSLATIIRAGLPGRLVRVAIEIVVDLHGLNSKTNREATA